jgi:hypothetical protein
MSHTTSTEVPYVQINHNQNSTLLSHLYIIATLILKWQSNIPSVHTINYDRYEYHTQLFRSVIDKHRVEALDDNWTLVKRFFFSFILSECIIPIPKNRQREFLRNQSWRLLESYKERILNVPYPRSDRAQEYPEP